MDAEHPAIRAAQKISDPSKQEDALKICHFFQKDFNRLIGWLLRNISNSQKILFTWLSLDPEASPILTSGALWEQEVVDVEKLPQYLTKEWKRSPLVIGDDFHTVVLSLQINKKEKKVTAHFYDPYEPFSEGNYLERKNLEALKYKTFPDDTIDWNPHYTKHQKLTAFGECSLYASAYHSFLLKKKDPQNLTEREVLEKVSALKEIMRENSPEYFTKYDQLFQFAFDSGLAGNLLEEIQKLSSNWGLEVEKQSDSPEPIV